MVRVVDPGEEQEAMIAEVSVSVFDPNYGFSRKIVAGSRVPVSLQAAYAEAAKPKKAAKGKKK